MSCVAITISEAVDRVSCRDPTLKCINLGYDLSDSDLAELIDCLLAHPDVITHLHLNYNQLTDETGIKLARYIANSSTIQYLDLYDNQFGEATYLAIAAALRINTSLNCLFLYDNQVVNKSRINCIDATFVDALILNPFRYSGSWWPLYLENECEFERLKKTADKLGHPTMQASLAMLAITI